MKWLLKILGAGLLGLVILILIMLVLQFFLLPGSQIKSLLPSSIQIPGLEIIITLIIIFLLGIIISHLTHRINKVPVIGPLLDGIQNLNKAEPVLVPYPHPGVYAYGFIMRRDVKYPKSNEPACLVFIPSTPNPTSGWLVIYRESEIVHLAKEEQEGILRTVMSGGSIQKNNRSH